MRVRGAIPTDGTVYQSANGLSFDRQNSDLSIGIRGKLSQGFDPIDKLNLKPESQTFPECIVL